MNKSKHDKGPWEAAFTEETAFITAPALCGNGHRFNIAQCDRTNDKSDANAQLIAAVPDLLEACQAMERAKDLWLPQEGEILESDEAEALGLLQNKILAAIEKATKC